MTEPEVRCARCRRTLQNPVYAGGLSFGVWCYSLIVGKPAERTKPAPRVKREPRKSAEDENQRELFGEVTA